MSKKIVTAVSVVAATMLLSFGQTTFAADKVVLKFAGQNAVDHPATDFMKDIAKEVAEKTEGRVEVKVYPANQLGNYSVVYQEQIRGTIDMSCISVPSEFDPRMEIVYINGYVGDYDNVKKIFGNKGWMFKKMSEYNERLGVKLLGFFIEGMIGTGSTKPAKDPINPKAEQGVLVRIPNMDVYKTAAEAMGYKTVTVPYTDVYQAIQTGVVDGVNGYPVAAAYTTLGDIIKYWYMTNYSLEVLNCMVSAKTWAKIDPKDQAMIEDIFARGTVKSVENAQKVDEHYMDLMKKKGIEVVTYTKEQLTPIMKACADSWTKLEKNMGKDLIDEFRKEMTVK